jgi:hypothetical protein
MAPPFLTSGLDGGERSAPMPQPLYSQRKNTPYLLNRRVVGPHDLFGP